MNILNIAPDNIREFLFKSNPETIFNSCTSNKTLLKYCDDRAFLVNYVYNNYDGLDLSTIKNRESYWDKFVFVYQLVRAAKEWISPFSPKDIKEDLRPLYGNNFKVTRDKVSDSLDNIFSAAIASESPKLFDIVLKIVGIYLFHEYMNTFMKLINRDTVEIVYNTIVARSKGTKKSGETPIDEMLFSLLEYYYPQDDSILYYGVTREAISKGNIELVNKLMFFHSCLDIPYDIEYAQIHNQDKIVELFSNYGDDCERGLLGHLEFFNREY